MVKRRTHILRGLGVGVLAVVGMTTASCGNDAAEGDFAAGSGGNGGFAFGGSSGAGGDPSCAGEVTTAERVPLDVYVMLDKSRSMLEPTADGGTKWDAIKSALATFVRDPESAGIGVGLQYFPLLRAGVPAECTSNADCGDAGPCIGHCRKAFDANRLVSCGQNADCGFGDQCQMLGTCSGAPSVACMPVGSSCGEQGECTAVPSTCLNGTTCEADAYAEPAVAVSPLPSGAADLVSSLETTVLGTDTPSRVALEGAIQSAQLHAQAHLDRRVIVLFATDGLPTQCEPITAQSLESVAAAGHAGLPSVSTFVVGVFAPQHAAEGGALLNLIARAGGTDSALIVSTNEDVTARFLAALNRLRTRLACELQLPSPAGGQALDLGRVNVEFRPSSGDPVQLPYVGSATACGTEAGWYYDADPRVTMPTKIVTCPATCEAFAAGGEVDIRVGCTTLVR